MKILTVDPPSGRVGGNKGLNLALQLSSQLSLCPLSVSLSDPSLLTLPLTIH